MFLLSASRDTNHAWLGSVVLQHTFGEFSGDEEQEERWGQRKTDRHFSHYKMLAK